MINSLKLIIKYYRNYSKKTNIFTKVLRQLSVFILILFMISYMFYYIVFIHNDTAAFKYADYDVEILNISPYQNKQIKGYDFVDKFAPYSDISGVILENGDLSISTFMKVLHTDDIRDVDYTPYSKKLIVERDENILNDETTNPILLYKSDAEKLNVKIGDKITTQIGEYLIEYTLAGIYEDAVQMSMAYASVVLAKGPLLDWILYVERKNNPQVTKEDILGSHGYIKFNDKEKGKEFIDNFYSDISLYVEYGEDYLEKATAEELEYYKGDYVYRDRQYKALLNNMTDGYTRVVAMITFIFLVLIIFMIWEQNKIISLTMQSISVFVASGCRKMAFLMYFFVSTFFRQIIYFIISIPIIKYLVMKLLSSENFHWYLPWYLVWENVPLILAAMFISAIVVSTYLYIKLNKKIVLFTGEE